VKEELKKRMVLVIGSYQNSLIELIAEQCAQIAVDYYKEREQALDTSSVRYCSCMIPIKGVDRTNGLSCQWCLGKIKE